MACTGALGRPVDDIVITDMVYVTPLVRPVRLRLMESPPLTLTLLLVPPPVKEIL